MRKLQKALKCSNSGQPVTTGNGERFYIQNEIAVKLQVPCTLSTYEVIKHLRKELLICDDSVNGSQRILDKNGGA